MSTPNGEKTQDRDSKAFSLAGGEGMCSKNGM